MPITHLAQSFVVFLGLCLFFICPMENLDEKEEIKL